ncbi:MAG TPA: metalloregulator ArsR/SmtB family transcription factor [Fimbriimonadaceae bacterium]|jgi:predicted transcriptional regulator
MPFSVVEFNVADGLEIMRMLASESRVKILQLLGQGELNINELSQELGLAQPTVTKHIQALEEAGLVQSDYRAGAQGTQKRCRRIVDRLVIEMSSVPPLSSDVTDIEMPMGLYSDLSIVPTCGLATSEAIIGHLDDPIAFHFPERAKAQILWSSAGYVEYIFPNSLPSNATIKAVDVAFEVCSETKGLDPNFQSDISVWINGIKIGTWTSPGDMGGNPGRLNPGWWLDVLAQYGFLKVWTVGRTGTQIDGMRISDVKIADLGLAPGKPTVVRIGNEPDAEHVGGFTLFGRAFGNYEQDIVLRLHTDRPKVKEKVAGE